MADYTLVHETFIGGIVRQLRARDNENADRYADILQNGETIRLPEIHTFHNSTDDVDISMCGWSQDDALDRLKKRWPTYDDEWEWVAQKGVAYPGLSTWRDMSPHRTPA